MNCVLDELYLNKAAILKKKEQANMKKAVISVGTKIEFATLLPVIPGKPLFCLLHAPTHTHTHVHAD